MNFDTPAPPPAPNPYQVSGAQTNSNIGTAIANTVLNNANQQTPWGNVSYTQSGNTTSITDPATGQVWEIPQYNVSTTLSPDQAHQKWMTDLIKNQSLDTGLQQVRNVAGTLAQPIDTSSLPGIVGSVGSGPQLQTQLANAGPINTTFGQTAGDIQYGVGPNDFSADRLRVEKAMFDRLNPQLERDRMALENSLVNQGFQRGTTAFTDAMGEYGRNVNDARLGITARGLQEQQGLFGMDLARGQFNNAAQAQDYQQQLGRGMFGLGAQQQQFGQNLQGAQFGNQAATQMFNNQLAGGQFQNLANQQALQQQLALRNQPINELSALLSGSQVSMPTGSPFQGGTVQPTNVSGNVYNSAALDQQNYATQQQAQNAMLGGLFGLGSAGLMAMNPLGKVPFMSDRRMKRDIIETGATTDEGLPIYLFRYLGGNDTVHIGVMADEVEQVKPEAVVEIGGIKHVDYSMIGI